MSNAPVTDDYLAASAYTDPVDKKKLRFVHAAVTRQAELRGVAPAELLLLDVACGVGGITLPLATFGGRVRAFDIDEADLSLLRERAVAAGFENILATREDALAFRDGREYDVIVASEVFEHLTHPDKLAENCARHLRRGGILVVTTPNGYGPWEMVNSTKLIPRRWNWLRRLVGKGPHDGAGREHEQRYTRGRLVAMFERHGLRRERASNSDFILTLSPRLRAHRVSGTIDCAMANLIPYWMASGWYLIFRNEKGAP